jgi:hypothetical protein
MLNPSLRSRAGSVKHLAIACQILRPDKSGLRPVLEQSEGMTFIV